MIVFWLFPVALAADLSFDEAIRASASSPEGRIALAEVRAARADLRGTAGWANPTLAWDREPGETVVAVSVPVGLAPLARAAAVRSGVEALALRERVAVAATGAATGAVWLDARRAADHAAAAARMQELAERVATAAARQVASGEWSELQGILARADAARALARALDWEQEAGRSRARLGVLVGAPVESLDAWPDIPPAPAADPATTPAVLAADLDARAALASRLAARLAAIPALEVGGGYKWGDGTGPVYGAELEIPLFSPGVSRIRGADAREQRADAAADLAALDSVAAVAAVATELAVAERLAPAWDIPGLDDALDATVRLYDAGELSLAEYVAQRDLAVLATQDAIDARWRLARARLAGWELIGLLPGESSP